MPVSRLMSARSARKSSCSNSNSRCRSSPRGGGAMARRRRSVMSSPSKQLGGAALRELSRHQPRLLGLLRTLGITQQYEPILVGALGAVAQQRLKVLETRSDVPHALRESIVVLERHHGGLERGADLGAVLAQAVRRGALRRDGVDPLAGGGEAVERLSDGHAVAARLVQRVR